MPTTTREVRISAADSDKNGVSDTVTIEFYEGDQIVTAAVAFDKNEDGTVDGGYNPTDADGDGDVDAADTELLQQIAALYLKLSWAGAAGAAAPAADAGAADAAVAGTEAH